MTSAVTLRRALVPAVALLVIGVHHAFAQGYLRVNHPAAREYPIRGLDVSHHQGAIAWPTVQNEGFAFAYVKATEGATYRDPRFLANVREAHAAGLAVGAYHFFTFCRGGADQAANVLAVVTADDAAPALSLPLAVDVETEGNCATRPTPAGLRAELDAFYTRLRQTWTRGTVLYTTQAMLTDYGDALPGGDRWIRSVAGAPAPGSARLWQFGQGRVRGIAGPVDLDVFCGDGWSAWKKPR